MPFLRRAGGILFSFLPLLWKKIIRLRVAPPDPIRLDSPEPILYNS